jgi:signal transduction histidine kinase
MSDAGSGEATRELVDRLQREVAELRDSRRRLSEAADADRRAIERALHDGVQQQLVALAGGLRRVSNLMDEESPAVRGLLDGLTANVREAIAEASDLAQRIYPPFLEAQGLAIALRSAAERAGVTLVVDARRSTGHSAEVNATVYWSCVEALSSAPRGSQVAVVVSDADEALAFEIQIAGRLTAAQLHHMRDRIEAVGGRLTAEHGKDGSHVHGWLPASG